MTSPYIELELLRCRVADAHRLRPLVPGQPGNLPLREPALASGAVHDLQVVGLAGGGARQAMRATPSPPSSYPAWSRASSVNVASQKPAEPVVPVADAADPLGE